MPNLPGDIKNVLGQGYQCDNHPSEEAHFRIQGETDSFGAEYIYKCTGCMELYQEELDAAEETKDKCDLCKDETIVKPWRDPDEGHNGPVYQACSTCILLHNTDEVDEDNSLYTLVFDEDEIADEYDDIR